MKAHFSREAGECYEDIEIWLKATLPINIVYLHRCVDTHGPSLHMHMVYFGSCLIDKYLRVLDELHPGTWIGDMRTRWERWERWDRPKEVGEVASPPPHRGLPLPSVVPSPSHEYTGPKP